MRKTHVIMFCFGLLCSYTTSGKSLLLKLNGSETITVNLKETPQYWVKGDYLYLKTLNDIQKFDVGMVDEIVFQDYSQAPTVNQDRITLHPTLATDYIYISGATDKKIVIFSANGKQMPVNVERQDGQSKICISNYPQGVYQLLCGQKTYKFIKGNTVN